MAGGDHSVQGLGGRHGKLGPNFLMSMLPEEHRVEDEFDRGPAQCHSTMSQQALKGA